MNLSDFTSSWFPQVAGGLGAASAGTPLGLLMGGLPISLAQKAYNAVVPAVPATPSKPISAFDNVGSMAAGNPMSGMVGYGGGSPTAQATNATPAHAAQPEPAAPGLPLSLAPPNPGPAATPQAPQQNGLMDRFVNALRGASAPQQAAPPQSNGLLPKLFNDVGALSKLFGSSGSFANGGGMFGGGTNSGSALY